MTSTSPQQGYYYEGVTYYAIDKHTCYFTFDAPPSSVDPALATRDTIIVHKYIYFIDHYEREVVRSYKTGDNPIPISEEQALGKDDITIILPDNITVYSQMFTANTQWTSEHSIGNLYIPEGVIFDTTAIDHTYIPEVTNLYLTTATNFDAGIFYAISMSTIGSLTIFGSMFTTCGLCYSKVSDYIKTPAAIFNYSNVSASVLSKAFNCTSIYTTFDENTFKIISLSKGR